MNEAIGEVLAEARRKLGKSIKEVELDTKIRAKYVEALERDDFDYLPGDIYTRGFIKTYAAYLGLDADPLIQQYKGLNVRQDDYDLSHMSSNMQIATKQRPAWLIPAVAVGAVAVIFVILIAWGAVVSSMSKKQEYVVQDIKTRGTTDTTVASATVSTTRKSAGGADSSDSERKSTTTTTEPDEKKGDGKIDVVVKLTGIENKGSWVRVKVDDEKVFEGMIQDGTSKLFKGDESVSVRVGYTPGLEIMLNGKKQPQLKTLEETFTKNSSKKRGTDGER